MTPDEAEAILAPIRAACPLSPPQYGHLLGIDYREAEKFAQFHIHYMGLSDTVKPTLYTHYGIRKEGRHLDFLTLVAVVVSRVKVADALRERLSTLPLTDEQRQAIAQVPSEPHLPAVQDAGVQANDAPVVMPFDFGGEKIRVLRIDGEPWFVGTDIANALGYVNSRKVVLDHCPNAQPVGGSRFVTPLLSLDPQTKIIPEADMYRLIMRSRKPAARAFEKLVMETILPAIRKTGQYVSPSAPAETLTGQAPTDMIATLRAAADQLETQGRTIEAQGQQIAAMQPSVDAVKRLSSAKGSLGVREAASSLNIGQKDLTKLLQDNDWAYRKKARDKNGQRPLRPVARAREQGFVSLQTTTYRNSKGEECMAPALKITPAGLAKLAQQIASTDP